MYKHILVPVVMGEGHDNAASFAVAQQLADESAVFTILHVQEPIPAYVLTEIPDDILNATSREARSELETLAKELPGAQAVLAKGQAGRAIVDYAEANGVDCIVMASHKPGLQNLFLGSTANRVVHHARCAVHVIR